jgi:peptidoglycan/LPS O-acetylase OafA/YrhL
LGSTNWQDRQFGCEAQSANRAIEESLEGQEGPSPSLSPSIIPTPLSEQKMTENFLKSRCNNFNLIRFIAAFMVLFSHSYPLSGQGPDPTFLHMSSYGGVAVKTFFILSGFLVSKSIMSTGGCARYVTNRFLRILPGLAVSTLVTMLFIGLFVTNLSVTEFFSNSSVYRFAFFNSTLISLKVVYHLPGAFLDNPSSAVNGSLWTLPFELSLYVSLVAASLVGVFRSRLAINILCIFLFSLFIWNSCSHHFVADRMHYYIRLSAMFYIGVFMWVNSHRLHLNFKGVAALLAIFAVVYFISDYKFSRMLFPFVLAYMIFCFAYLVKGPILKFNKLGDYSYGIYLCLPSAANYCLVF